MADETRPYERRRAPRIPVRFPVTLTCGKKKINCNALEISEFGVLLAAKQKELVGQEVAVGLALDSQNGILPLKGIVAYATDTGVGVRFKEVTEEQQISLKHYITSRKSTG